MTPAEHLAAAKDLADNPPKYFSVIELGARRDAQLAHAYLGRAVGSGSHYNAADALLAAFSISTFNGGLADGASDTARQALAHAAVADLV